MIRRFALGIAIGWLTTASVAQERGQPRTASRAQPVNTIGILSQRVPELTFDEVPLEQVIEWLGEFTNLNINVRWQFLADAGVDRDTPISLRARNLRLSQVLWLIMNEAAGPDLKLGYRASGNLLVLSTVDDLDKELVTKIYDVADLLVRLPRAGRQGAFNVSQGLGQTSGQGGGGGGGAGGGMFGQGQGQQQQAQAGRDGLTDGAEAQIEELVSLIRETVEPDSWRENGGTGTIIPFQRSIVVRNTLLVHQLLGGYVTDSEAGGR
jgi:hypothetical protein